MQIKTISVSHQRKMPHPNVDFANYTAFVRLAADLDETDNAAACVKKLQAQAENLVDQYFDALTERSRQRSRPEAETAKKAAALAEKHGGRL